MAKKKSLCYLVNWIFISETHLKSDKKDKRRRWVFGRLKIKRLQLAPKEVTVSEAEEEQINHASEAFILTAGPSDGTVTAARIASGVAAQTFTATDSQEVSAVEILSSAPQFNLQPQRDIREFAAIKIQTAFRGYLARKALRALKGLVRLQAIIRGRAVRRQALATLKCLQSIVNIQSQIRAGRIQLLKEALRCDDDKSLHDRRDSNLNIESKNERRWEASILSKEEANALFLSKKEALLKRERIKEYSFNQGKPTPISEEANINGRWRYWLEQWVDNSDAFLSPNTRNRDELNRKQLRLKTFQKQYQAQGLDSPLFPPRRSFQHKKQKSYGDDNSFSSSPITIPTYMATTESAKAKARSMSLPKPRPERLDTYSETDSPYKNKLSVLSSEVKSSGKIAKGIVFEQRSPSLKSLPGPLKSNRIIKDLSFESECSLLNLDRNSIFR